MYGDADRNGRVDITDAFLVLQYYANHNAGNLGYTFTEYPEIERKLLPFVDIDHDQSITISDAYYILKYYSLQYAGAPAAWDEIQK